MPRTRSRSPFVNLASSFSPTLTRTSQSFLGWLPTRSQPGFRRQPPFRSTASNGPLSERYGFAWAEPTSFDRKVEAALRAVAFLCVEQTVERAERYDADHDLILALQNRLLGNLPVLAGTAISARYLTASSEATVGGDWYEGLPRRRVHRPHRRRCSRPWHHSRRRYGADPRGH